MNKEMVSSLKEIVKKSQKHKCFAKIGYIARVRRRAQTGRRALTGLYLITIFVLFLLFISATAFAQKQKQIDSIENILKSADTDTTIINLKIHLCNLYYEIDTLKASLLFTEILKEIETKGTEISHCTEFKIGKIFQNHRNDIESALIYYERAFQNALKEKDHSYVDYEAWIGYTLSSSGNSEDAIERLFHAVGIAENNNMIKKLPRLYLLTAFAFRYNHNLDKAEWYFNKSIESSIKTGDSTDIHYALHEIGNIYSIRNDFKKSVEYHNKALKIREKNNNLDHLLYSYHDMGIDYFYMDSLEIALDFFNKAEKLAKELNNLWLLFNNYADMNEIFIRKNDFIRVRENLNEMQVIAEKLKMKSVNKSLYNSNYKYFKAIKQYDKALRYYEMEVAITDSITNEEIQKNISELDKKYETAKKDKELFKNQAFIKRQHYIIISTIMGLFIVVVFMIIIFRQYRQKKEANAILANQKEGITAQRDEIEKKSETLKNAFAIIEQKNTNITSSIKYAHRIQQAILPSDELIQKLIPNSFIIFKPKDIVSGDFYWLDQKNEQSIYFAAVDCTGHGVPGALLSIHAYNLLDKALNELQITKPSEILNYLSLSIKKTMQHKDEKTSVKDSMDISLCCYHKEKNILEFAGANQPLLIISNHLLTEFKPDKHPIGFSYNEDSFNYRNIEINIGVNDLVYIFTDGFSDQFGGEDNQKYMIKKLKRTLEQISDKAMNEQREFLTDSFDQWKKDKEQVDDVLLMGIKL